MDKGTIIDVDTLEKLYLQEQKSMREISEILGVAVGTVYNYIRFYEIPSRQKHQGFKGKKHTEITKEKIRKKLINRTFSEKTIKKMSEAAKNGGIGHKKERTDGYVMIYFPDHPCSSKEGYIMEHILVMEALIGRHLYSYECVHHINGKKRDNRKENLQLMTKSAHMSLHMSERWKKKKGGMTY